MEQTARRRRGRKILLGLAAALAGLAGLAVWQRTELRARYYGWQAGRAPADQKAGWLEALAGLGDPARPRLTEYLRRDDADLCRAAAAALEKFAADGRAALARELAEALPTFSPPGQSAALALAGNWSAGADPAVTEACHELILAGMRQPHPEVRVAGAAAALGP